MLYRCVFFLIFLVSQIGYAAPPIGYEMGKDVGLSIVRNFPPSEYYYLGIGRSPTPVIAFLQAILPANSASNLPFGGGSYNLGFMLSDMKDGNVDFNGVGGAILKKHFDRFVPSKSQLNGRRILLIDFSKEGNSLALIHSFVAPYLKIECPNCELEAVGFHSSSFTTFKLNEKNLHSLQVKDTSLFANETFDSLAEYKTYLIGNELGDSNPKYAVLRDDYRREAAIDPNLVHFDITKSESCDLLLEGHASGKLTRALK